MFKQFNKYYILLLVIIVIIYSYKTIEKFQNNKTIDELYIDEERFRYTELLT